MGTLKIGTAVVAAAAAALLSACGSSSAPAGGGSTVAPLVGTSWVLTAFLDASGAQATPAAEGATPTLAFTDTAVSGSTGCNRFSGTYTQNGSAVTVAVGAVTRMACPGAVDDQEQAVLADLGKVASAAGDGTTLTLKDASGADLLTYEAGTAGLAGTSWTATGINNGKGGVEATADTSAVTAEFGDDGSLSGNGGCNTYSATWEASGPDGLTLGPVASTQMACDLLDLEQQYFQALSTVATYTIEGDTLTLRDADGSTQVTYAAS